MNERVSLSMKYIFSSIILVALVSQVVSQLCFGDNECKVKHICDSSKCFPVRNYHESCENDRQCR